MMLALLLFCVTIVLCTDVFIALAGNSTVDDSSRMAIMDVLGTPANSRVVGNVCCGMSLPTGNPNIGLALSTVTNELITAFKATGETKATIAVIDPCSGATDYDKSFLLEDSNTPMPMAVDPTTGLVYMLQTLNGTRWSLYTVDLTTKKQTLVRKFTETGLNRCRALAFDPTNPNSLLYGVQIAGGGMSSLMALNKTTGEFVFRDVSIGVQNLFAMTFNSSGVLFGFRKDVAPTAVVTISFSTTAVGVTTASATAAGSIPGINNVRSALALPPSFANCLLSSGPAGRLLLSDGAGTSVRYSKSPEFQNDNQIALVDGLIRNSGLTIADYEFYIVAPLGTTQLSIDNVTIDGQTAMGVAHTEGEYPWTVNAGTANTETLITLRFGRYNITYTAIRSKVRQPSVTATFSLVDPRRTTTSTSTTTKATTKTTSTTTTSTTIALISVEPTTSSTTTTLTGHDSTTVASNYDLTTVASRNDTTIMSGVDRADSIPSWVWIIVGVGALVVIVLIVSVVVVCIRTKNASSAPIGTLTENATRDVEMTSSMYAALPSQKSNDHYADPNQVPLPEADDHYKSFIASQSELDAIAPPK